MKDYFAELPKEKQDEIRARLDAEDAERYRKYKNLNLSIGSDVTGLEVNVKANTIPSGYVDEPEVYDEIEPRFEAPTAVAVIVDDTVVDTVRTK